MNTETHTKKIAITSVAVASLLLASTAFAHGPGKRGEGLFKHMDTNSDGKVTLAEVKQASQKRFTEADSNKDGKVTREELKAAFEKRRAQWAKTRPEGAKGKGKAEGERHHGKRGGDMGARFFAKIDTNGDGAIDKKESAATAERRFARMDANSDGVVTPDELHRGRGHGCRDGKGSGKGHERWNRGAPEGAAGSGA